MGKIFRSLLLLIVSFLILTAPYCNLICEFQSAFPDHAHHQTHDHSQNKGTGFCLMIRAASFASFLILTGFIGIFLSRQSVFYLPIYPLHFTSVFYSQKNPRAPPSIR